jgi:folate-binding protein YgfZ
MNVSKLPLVPLPYVRILSVTGSDATAFLQAQLSRRVDNLSPSRSALAGWHDARGKVRAIFRVIEVAGGYLLVAPADLADQLISTMSMFVLRSDVRIESTELICAGLVSLDPDVEAGKAGLPNTVNSVVSSNGLSAICVASGCWHIIGPGEALPHATDSDCSPVAAAEIRAGLPQVDQQTTLRYVPHMLNLDKLDAIDFEKGCYPGQEIIARTEHLGSVKRRAQAFTVNAEAAPVDTPSADTPIVDSHDEHIGQVLRAARDSDGSIVLLAVVTLSALDGAAFLSTPEGPQLERLKLPFA